MLEQEKSEFKIEGRPASRILSINFDMSNTKDISNLNTNPHHKISSLQNEQHGIILDENVKREYLRYGSEYVQEAKRILTYMPQFPSKYQDP